MTGSPVALSVGAGALGSMEMFGERMNVSPAKNWPRRGTQRQQESRREGKTYTDHGALLKG